MEEMFNGAKGVVALLTYDSVGGTPLAVVRGKVREREVDNALLLAWLRALAHQIDSSLPVTVVDNKAAPESA